MQVIAGQQIPKGFWLVPAQWYKLTQTSQRAYVVLGPTIQLNVNAMVRLPEPVEFEPVKARKAPPVAAADRAHLSRAAARGTAPPPQLQAPAKGREKPQFLGEPVHNEILASLANVRS